MRDLWPESIVAIGVAKESSLFVRAMYKMEKWILKRCDALITTFEGGYDYIEKKGYVNILPRDKFYYINNGTDLNQFDECVRTNTVDDPDLENNQIFKVMYTGSLRLANGLDQLLGCARELKENNNIQFFIYGKGEHMDELYEIIKRDNLTNVHMKGSIEKKYVPYILSKGKSNLARQIRAR